MNHQKPTLTVFADASIQPKFISAGWGGWVRGDDRKPLFGSGRAPYRGDTSLVELSALVLWLERLYKDRYFSPADTHISLQSDSLGALQRLKALPNTHATHNSGDARITSPILPTGEYLLWAERLQAITTHCDVIYLKHVRGHQGGKHSRSWINERCDTLAKKAARNFAH